MRVLNESLAGQDFRETDLTGSSFRGCDLSGANFSSSNCTGVNFIKCKLSGTNFKGAILDKTNFELADFTGLDLAGAIYGGKMVSHGPVKIEADYYTLITDVFSQFGCASKSNEEWLSLSDADRSPLDYKSSTKPNIFWNSIYENFNNILNGWK